MFIEILDSCIKSNEYKGDYTVNGRINPANSPFNANYSPLEHAGISYDEKQSLIKIVSTSPYIQQQLCNMYYFKLNCGVDLTTVFICSALRLNARDLSLLCLLFKQIIFSGNLDYELKTELDNEQWLQATGLNDLGLEITKGILSSSPVFNELYNSKVSMDNRRNEFYLYKQEDLPAPERDNTYSGFVEGYFKNPYNQKCGKLNVSALSMEQLQTHRLCQAIAAKVSELYLHNYELEFNRKTYYVKFLSWY